MAKLNAAFAIVDKLLKMSPAFRDEMIELNLLKPILGTGTPEGNFEGRLYQLYIDKAGLAGNIEYRKMQSEIGGDTTKGWLQV